jgi:hypothetical protein
MSQSDSSSFDSSGCLESERDLQDTSTQCTPRLFSLSQPDCLPELPNSPSNYSYAADSSSSSELPIISTYITEPLSHFHTETPPGQISVHTYNRHHESAFTELATLNALYDLGIEPSELFMPTSKQLSKYPNDSDIRRLVISHHSARIDRLCVRIAERREVILHERKELRTSTKLSAPEEEAGFVKIERRRLEHARELQRREAENFILRALAESERAKESIERDQQELERLQQIKEEREKQSAEAHRRHFERMQELEEQERRRLNAEEQKRKEQFEKDQRAIESQKRAVEERLKGARENEKRRQKKCEQNRKHLEEFEEERRLKIIARGQAHEEREARRQQIKAEESKKIKKEKLAEHEKREMLIRNVRMGEAQKLEQKRREGEERERKQTQRAAEYQARLEQQQKEWADNQRLKIERTGELRKKIEEDDHRRKEKQASENTHIRKYSEDNEEI